MIDGLVTVIYCSLYVAEHYRFIHIFNISFGYENAIFLQGIQATSDHMRMRVFHTADLALQDEVILSTAGPANASLQLLMLSVVL